MFGLRYGSRIQGAVRAELENFNAGLSGWSQHEHKPDGTHGDVTADSLTLQGAEVGLPVDLPLATSRLSSSGGTSVWTYTADATDHLRVVRVGRLAMVQFSFASTAVSSSAANYLIILLPELHAQPFGVSGSASEQHGGPFFWNHSTGPTWGVGAIKIAFDSTTVDANTQLQLYKSDHATFATGGTWRIAGTAWITLTDGNAKLG